MELELNGNSSPAVPLVLPLLLGKNLVNYILFVCNALSVPFTGIPLLSDTHQSSKSFQLVSELQISILQVYGIYSITTTVSKKYITQNISYDVFGWTGNSDKTSKWFKQTGKSLTQVTKWLGKHYVNTWNRWNKVSVSGFLKNNYCSIIQWHNYLKQM